MSGEPKMPTPEELEPQNIEGTDATIKKDGGLEVPNRYEEAEKQQDAEGAYKLAVKKYYRSLLAKGIKLEDLKVEKMKGVAKVHSIMAENPPDNEFDKALINLDEVCGRGAPMVNANSEVLYELELEQEGN
jgi:hypothetical protein